MLGGNSGIGRVDPEYYEVKTSGPRATMHPRKIALFVHGAELLLQQGR
jgi:hypothetical protein